MRELAVYYCSHCGFYGYYQLSKNATCPKCDIPMNLHKKTFKEFTNLNCEERDALLSETLIASTHSIVERITLPHKAANNREVVARLTQRVNELEEENKKLNDTVSWMHDTIWNLLKTHNIAEKPIINPKVSQHN